MELLQRFPLPRRLAARLWLLTIPSALLSFERRQRLPKLPIGRGRLAGLLLIAAGVAAVLRGRRLGARSAEPARGLARLRKEPAVVGGLLALTGVGLLLRSLVLIAYAFGLGVAFARDAVELEEPRLAGQDGDGSREYDETRV
jgi:protein-S-isoprenylcysteine O-methyltransferase Ste14